MAWTLCSSGAAIDKAGTNSTIAMGAASLALLSEQTEGWINARTRKDWIAEPATANFTGALADVSSSHIGNKLIAADMSGYTSRAEAQTMLDVNENIIRQGLKDIAQKENQEVMD